MNYQSAARNQRPKGFKVKRAFQFALLLAVCIWLLYQIKHSHDKTKDNGGNIQRKLSEEHGAAILGRKGIAGWSNSEGDSNSDDEGDRDNELDKNPEEKSEEESYLKENENIHENPASNGGKQDQKEPERQYEKSQINEDKNSGIQIGEGIEAMSLNEDMYKKDEADHTRTSIWGKDEAVKVSNEDKDTTEVENKISVNSSGIDNATVPGHSEMEDGVHSFRDENGVPQGVDNILESSADKRDFLHQNVISSSNDHIRVNESMPEGEEVESKQGTNIADAETGSNSVIKDSKIGTTVEAEFNLQTSLHADV